MTKEELGTYLLTRNHKEVYQTEDTITKVYDHTHYTYSDVLKEAMNQEYALECGFKAPKVYSVFKVGEDYAISSERIVGKTLEELIAENPANKKKYISELIKIQLSLLEFHSDNLKLPKLKDKLNGYVIKSDLESTTKYELQAILEKMPNHYKLCHGDIYFNNIIKKGDEYYILDWAHATRGNSSADAATTYILFLLAGDDKGAKTYLKEFAKKRKITEAYIESWVSVVSAAKLNSVESVEQKALLLRNINVAEY